MKTFNIALLSAAVLLGLATTPVAQAAGRGHGGFHHHGGGGVRFGVFVGAPFYYPYYRPYYYPPAYYPYYYPPAYAAPASPPVYIEQGAGAAPAAPTAQASGSFWYYCPDSRTYYPYVQQCNTPWQQVTPQATPPS